MANDYYDLYAKWLEDCYKAQHKDDNRYKNKIEMSDDKDTYEIEWNGTEVSRNYAVARKGDPIVELYVDYRYPYPLELFSTQKLPILLGIYNMDTQKYMPNMEITDDEEVQKMFMFSGYNNKLISQLISFINAIRNN